MQNKSVVLLLLLLHRLVEVVCTSARYLLAVVLRCFVARSLQYKLSVQLRHTFIWIPMRGTFYPLDAE